MTLAASRLCLFIAFLAAAPPYLLGQGLTVALTPEETKIVREVADKEFQAIALSQSNFRIMGGQPALNGRPQAYSAPLGDLTAFQGSASTSPRTNAIVPLGEEIVTPVPGDTARRAVATRYLYGRGAVARIFVDLQSKVVVGRDIHFNSPAPLAEEEIKKALEIARARNSELNVALAGALPDDITVYAQPIINNNQASSRYAHRLTEIFVGLQGADRPIGRFFVDLSVEELVVGRH